MTQALQHLQACKEIWKVLKLTGKLQSVPVQHKKLLDLVTTLMENTGHMELLSQLKGVEADIWQYDKRAGKANYCFLYVVAGFLLYRCCEVWNSLSE